MKLFPSDIEIAQKSKISSIKDVAQKLHINEDDLELYPCNKRIMFCLIGFISLFFLHLLMALMSTAGLLPMATITSCLERIPTALVLGVPF